MPFPLMLALQSFPGTIYFMERDAYHKPKLSPESSVEFTRNLVTAYQIRSSEAQKAGKILTLEEREAWRKLFDLIDPEPLGDASDIIPQLLEDLDKLSRFQARVELGRVANLDS